MATTIAPDIAVPQFFASFSAALRAGDSAFFAEHLHPFVLDRYDSAMCAAQLQSLVIPQGAIEVVAIVGIGAWEWITDGISRTIDGVTTVQTRTTSDGTTFTDAESHVVVDGGLVQWFTDCGEPKQGAL